MECQRIRENISAYIDDELSAEEKTAFNEHLLHCEHCREEYRTTLLLSQDISSLPLCETERDFSKEWKRFVRLEQGEFVPRHAKRKYHKETRRSPYFKGVLAIAACLLLISVAAVAGTDFLFEHNLSISDAGSSDQVLEENQPVSSYDESEITQGSEMDEISPNDESDNTSDSQTKPQESDDSLIDAPSVSASNFEDSIDLQEGTAQIVLSAENTESIVEYLAHNTSAEVEEYSNDAITCMVASEYFSSFLENLYTKGYLQSEAYERLSSWNLSESNSQVITCTLTLNQ